MRTLTFFKDPKATMLMWLHTKVLCFFSIPKYYVNSFFVRLTQTATGDTELILATEAGALDVVRYLILNRSDVNQANRKKMGALHYAAKIGNVAITNLLCAHGADINIQVLHSY